MEWYSVALLTAGIMCILFGIALILVVKHMRKKFDGYLDVSERDTSKVFQLDLQTDPEKLRKQKTVVFKVRKISDL